MDDIARLLHEAAQQGFDDPFGAVEGFLHPMEGYALMLLAALGPGTGEVLEIGSFLGRSACFLAQGLKMRGQGVVHCVDHFRGSPEHQKGRLHEQADLMADGTLLNRFRANLELFGLNGLVRPQVSDSLNAATHWDASPIRLLFIDGDHSYEATRADFEAWQGFVAPEGVICFHDVSPSWPGVTRFHAEITAPGTGWRNLLAVGSLRAVGRTG